jgi:hypothetical protein
MDSHADTCCANEHAYVESIVEGITVDAVPFDETIGKVENLPIVHAIYAVDDPITFATDLIRLCNSIYIPHMKNALLCPNQARAFGIIIEDTPLEYDDTSRFAIIASDTENTTFPLQRYGPTAYMHVRRPTEEELTTITPIDLTEEEEWNPYPHGDDVAQYNINSVQRVESTGVFSGAISPIGRLRQIHALRVSKPKDTLTPEHLAKIWNIGVDTARKTIDATTCKHYRNVQDGISRTFRPRRNFLRYKQLRLPAGEFYTDTFISKIKSVRGYSYMQVYGNKFGFIKAYPMESKNRNDVGSTLTVFIQDVGVPQKMHTDNAPEMVGRKTPFFKRARKEGIDLTTIEPERPDENYGEILVRITKHGTAKMMIKRRVPLRLWCYAAEFYTERHSLTVPGMYRNKGRTGYEITLGVMPDISEYIDFDFYDYYFYWDNPQSYPQERKHIGRWLGIAHCVGQALVYWVMNNNGVVVARSTVIPLKPEDYDVDENKERSKDLDEAIHSRIGDYRNALNENQAQVPVLDEKNLEEQLLYCFDMAPEDLHENEKAVSNPNCPDIDGAGNDVESGAFDKFLGLHVQIPGEDKESVVLGKVINRKRDHDNNLIGSSNDNPILNTAVYNVQTPDGVIHEYTANIIAEHLWNQVDDDGWEYGLMYEIVDHRMDAETAIPKSKGMVEIAPGGARRRVITTKGWDFQVKWETGETTWIPLKDIKESNAADVAAYAIREGIADEPAFAWWVKTAIKQRDAMVNKVCRRIRKRSKFGIEIHDTFEEAVALDRKNGNTLWQDAVKKEMNNVKVAFDFKDNRSQVPNGFKRIDCHIIYDVKFDLTRKARYVGGGHRTQVPASMTYLSVVSRDSVRIMFLVAALNELDIKMCDIGNAYLNAETRERLWFQAGPEWGSREGRPVIIVRALYGLKSSGAEWKKTFASYIRHTLGYEPCIGADDNVYLKSMKDTDGNEYYSYLIVYVDDVLCLDKDPNRVLWMVNRDYRLKEPPAPPAMYLGADFCTHEIAFDGILQTTCWAMSADSHIKKALQVIKEKLTESDVFFRSGRKAEQPFSCQTYRPELDITEECNDEQLHLFQSLIGIARWLCELGRLDILTET